MKFLLAVVFASACVGPLPTQQPPVVEYPHARSPVGQSGYCSVLRLQRALDYYLTCSFRPTDHR